MSHIVWHGFLNGAGEGHLQKSLEYSLHVELMYKLWRL